MRESCTDCVLKHIAVAHILLHEAKMGYPNHVYLALGHLAQAEVELAAKHLDVARELRIVRKHIEEEENADFNVMEWIERIQALDMDDEATEIEITDTELAARGKRLFRAATEHDE